MKHLAFYIANFNHAAGTERCLSIIASKLASNYKVSIISVNEGLDPYFSINPNIKLYSLEAEKITKHKTLPILRRLLKLHKLLKFDCIIVVDICIYLPVFLFKIFTHIKTIAWEHFNCEIERSKIDMISRKLAVKNANKIIVLGKNDLLNYKKKFPKLSHIDYIYNPIAFDIINNFNVCSRRIIAAGRLEKQKGFDLLIEVWKLIEPLSKDWELDIFGEGSLELELKNQINKYGLKKIHIKGFANDLQKELKNAGIFAFSSRYEGFGLVLLEAQAQGLPIISFNCKEGPAEIIDDGVNGFLVDPEDVNDFAEKLLKLMLNDNLRISFSKNSQKDLYRFNLDNITNKWVEVLNEILIN